MFNVVCKEDSAPRDFPQSSLMCIQVGLFWITAVAPCEDKLVCTWEVVCKKGGLREVICISLRLGYSQTQVEPEGFDEKHFGFGKSGLAFSVRCMKNDKRQEYYSTSMHTATLCAITSLTPRCVVQSLCLAGPATADCEFLYLSRRKISTVSESAGQRPWSNVGSTSTSKSRKSSTNTVSL